MYLEVFKPAGYGPFFFSSAILDCCSCSFQNFKCVYAVCFIQERCSQQAVCPDVTENSRIWLQERLMWANKPGAGFWGQALISRTRPFLSLGFLERRPQPPTPVFTLHDTIPSRVSSLLGEQGSGFEAEEFHLGVVIASRRSEPTVCTI